MSKKINKTPIEQAFYDILTCKAKKEFTTASSFCMSVYCLLAQ